VGDITAELFLDDKGNLQIQEGPYAVFEAIKNICLNEEGEDIMGSRYGSVLYSLLHEDINDDTAFVVKKIVEDLLREVSIYIPISGIKVVVNQNEMDERFEVVITYKYAEGVYSGSFLV